MKLINTGPEPFFEDVVDHMAAICSVPIARIAIAKSARQWVNGYGAAKGHEAKPGETFDAISLLGRVYAVVNDCQGAPEFADAGVGSYICSPLVLNGIEVGCLYLADAKPRVWSDFEISYMVRSSRLVANHFEARTALAERDRREQMLADALKAAERAVQSKQQFLANMSHEIRTPLNGILGMAQVLGATELDPSQRDYVSTIIESGRTLTSLLNDVLDLSKIEAGRFEIAPTDDNLAKLLRRQLLLWRPRAVEKGLDLSLSLDWDLPEFLSFDTVRVQQCVSNLVSNAIKFTETGRIEIIAASRRAPGGYMVEIRVRDTGPGMDEETLSRLFQPFVQADETTQRSHGGTGLGLSITRRLAELMGGKASATSTQGQGSTFTFSFRAGLASCASDDATSEPVQAGDARNALRLSNLRILLVDDHPVNRQIVSLFLKPFNFQISEATNGQECLDALAAEPFDLALLDMHMPVMDGPATIGCIRAGREPWASIPVIALTADAMSGDRERYLAMGMNGYLSKPLAERDLLIEIARVCAEAELSRAA